MDSKTRAEITESRKLKSINRGDSEIEQLAERIETRRANRIVVIFPVRVKFLKLCWEMASEKGHYNKIHVNDLIVLRDLTKEHYESQHFDSVIRKFLTYLGFRDRNYLLLQVLERAVERVEELESDYLYYQDFTFDETKLESQWPWLRSTPFAIFIVLFGFLFFTPVLFCAIMEDKGVCPDDPTDQNRSYYGWMTAVYFASTTMSTVGYGDFTVSKDEKWRVFIGAIYMILAIVVAVTAFSRAAASAYDFSFARFNRMTENMLEKLSGRKFEKKLLYQHIRRIKWIKISEIVLQLALLNFIGIVVSRYFANRPNEPDQQWDWMTSFYWAVQTTTTIGYGDLDMPFELQWFQILYLTFGTVFVGNAFGKLGSLGGELNDLKCYYAWQRREVSKRMIEEMQAYEHDDKVDQYEFTIASLLMLGKISSTDIAPIMDKFRLLSGSKGYIQITSEDTESSTNFENHEQKVDYDDYADIDFDAVE